MNDFLQLTDEYVNLSAIERAAHQPGRVVLNVWFTGNPEAITYYGQDAATLAEALQERAHARIATRQHLNQLRAATVLAAQ